MDITVCICTYNRPDYIRGCLDGLRQQTVPSNQFEILVVDSASTGDVPAQLARMVVEIDNARVLRIEQPGISIARNAGARQARAAYVAYIDDDAIPAADWVERIVAAIGAGDRPPSLIGGRILPRWEAPLPAWWPAQLRGVLSIIECEGEGEYRTGQLPAGLEPYGANMVVHVPSLFAVGGFGASIGRLGKVLLSDEEVQVAWRMQAAGHLARYNSRIVVQHRIQATRLTPGWLLSRLYLAGRVHRAHAPVAWPSRLGLARIAASRVGGGRAGTVGPVALPQHAAGSVPLAAGLRARLHLGGTRLGGRRGVGSSRIVATCCCIAGRARRETSATN